jgi:omega-6 fatty acid desaturase (delta-12 desaturase)
VQRSLKEIRAAIPSELFVRDMTRGLLFLARDISMAIAVWSFATRIDPLFQHSAIREILTPVGAEIGRWAAWGV